jgi:RimJ/RimL family protein N-acetyltransferase
MKDLTVRQATSADVDEMLDVLEAVAAERRFIATEPPVDREARRAAFLRLLEGDGCFLVAEADGEVVGSLGVEVRRGRGELGMAVAAERRGRGVGTALLSAAIDWARESGLHKLALEVFPHNEAALALYRKFGFEQEGYLRSHERRASGELWDAIAMGLPLRVN